jgi:hypothetical protein
MTPTDLTSEDMAREQRIAELRKSLETCRAEVRKFQAAADTFERLIGDEMAKRSDAAKLMHLRFMGGAE